MAKTLNLKSNFIQLQSVSSRLLKTADKVNWSGWQFEVVDLDDKRIDKVLANFVGEPT